MPPEKKTTTKPAAKKATKKDPIVEALEKIQQAEEILAEAVEAAQAHCMYVPDNGDAMLITEDVETARDALLMEYGRKHFEETRKS